MKLLLENWRKFVTESKKRTGTLNAAHTGKVYTYGLYSKNLKTVRAGKKDDVVEIISGWQDQGVEWKLVNIDGVEGWVEAEAVDEGSITEEVEAEPKIYSFDFDNTLIRYHTLEDGDVEYLGPHQENIQKVRDLAAAGHTVIIVTSR